MTRANDLPTAVCTGCRRTLKTSHYDRDRNICQRCTEQLQALNRRRPRTGQSPPP